jgi:hypothetical protein
MITIPNTVYDPDSGETPIGHIARQGCLWSAVREGEEEPFIFVNSREAAIDAVRSEFAESKKPVAHVG